MGPLIFYYIAQPQKEVDEGGGEGSEKGEKDPFSAMKMLTSSLGNQSDAPGQPPSSEEEEGRQAEGKYGQAIIVTKILILGFSQVLPKNAKLWQRKLWDPESKQGTLQLRSRVKRTLSSLRLKVIVSLPQS